MDKKCLYCEKANLRPQSDFCCQQCSRTHKLRVVGKNCAICSKKIFVRGRTCSPEHTLELKKLTNRKKFGSDWAIQTPDAKKKRVATNIEKYGETHHLKTEESLKKLRETNRERYGVEYPGQNAEVKEKMKSTNLSRYGAENVFGSEAIKERIKNHHLAARGVPYPAQDPLVMEKIKTTNLARYGAENQFQRNDFQERMREHYMATLGVPHPWKDPAAIEKYKNTCLERYGVPHPMQTEEVRQRVATIREEGVKSGRYYKAVSKHNLSTGALIEERYGVTVAYEKAVAGRSYDLFLEGTNILIELNPLISHNADIAYACVMKSCELPCGLHKPPANGAHFNKSKIAKDSGYRLFQFYEWDSIEDIFKILDGKLNKNFQRISARKLSLRELSVKEANKFLVINHSQGSVRGQKILLGLFREDEIYAVATFGQARFGRKSQWEFLRYAVKESTIVHGGAGALFGAFVAMEKPESVVSYLDFDHTTAELTFLHSLDFVEDSPTGASLNWYNPKTKRRFNNSLILSLGADRALGTNYGSKAICGLSNDEIMRKEGYFRVFTSGSRVLLWNKTDS